MEMVSVGHTNFLVKAQLTWVQDTRSSPKSLETSNNTLNISYKTNIAHNQIIIDIDFIKILIIVDHNNFSTRNLVLVHN